MVLGLTITESFLLGTSIAFFMLIVYLLLKLKSRVANLKIKSPVDLTIKTPIGGMTTKKNFHAIKVKEKGIEKIFSSIDEMPPELREKFEEAMEKGTQFSMKSQKIIYKGKEYASADDIPDPLMREFIKKTLEFKNKLVR